MAESKRLIGQTLVRMGMITHEQLNSALAEQKRGKQKIGRILVQRGLISEQQLIEVLSFLIGIPHLSIESINIQPEMIKLVPIDLIHKYRVFPLQLQNNTLTLAMLAPLNHQAIEDVQMATGLNVSPVLVGDEELDLSIRNYLTQGLDPNIEKIINQLKREPMTAYNDDTLIIGSFDDGPIIQVIDTTLKQAVRDKASDVHIEPQEMETRVRFRIDGLLNTVFTIPKVHHSALVSRLKIMGGMNIAEKRAPQDGRFSMYIDSRQVDFRVSVLPVSGGEKVVLRILDRLNALTTIEELGLTAENREKMLQLAHRPHGMLLVTGPTGSGKTTTLYSILHESNSSDKNIITLEDPIEYSLEGINQVQINPRAGLTFATGLRACIRQDPNILMVGEIRDKETAELAVHASLTGHLVISTLHTSSAAGSIARLIDMGIEHFLLGSCLTGIVAQRLIRQLCRQCRESFVLGQQMAEHLGIPQYAGQEFFRPVGCRVCRHQGYQGRIAIHEILMANRDLRGSINRADFDEASILQLAKSTGFTDMKEDGISKARTGLTSLEEVLKAVLWKD